MSSAENFYRVLSLSSGQSKAIRENNVDGQYMYYTVEPQWLEHLWDHGNLFET